MVDHKHGAVRCQRTWVKTHIMTGAKTNVVTAVEIRDKDASDTKLLPDLLATTAKNFTVCELSAHKGDSSIKNMNVVGEYGATPYIAYKSDANGRDKHGKSTGLWEKMLHYFHFRRDEFLSHYHKRSNVESTFSAIKRKFGDSVRSK